MSVKSCTSLKMNSVFHDFEERGFSTIPFPDELRRQMISEIEFYIQQLGRHILKSESYSLEQIATQMPDEIWSKVMNRAFRMFSKPLSERIAKWADVSLTKEFGRKRSSVNVVYPYETQINPKIREDNLAIYWRCVRSGKPDAGRAHRDASFWDIEFQEGYDPKIPFPFDYIKDCIKIWIPLIGCVPTTTLQIIPYSHKMDVPTILVQTEYGRRPTIQTEWLQKHEADFVSPVELSEGACILFDMNLVHRGPAHEQKSLRISAELNFIVG